MTDDLWKEDRKYVLEKLNGIEEAQKEFIKKSDGNDKEISNKLDDCHKAIIHQGNVCDEKYMNKTHARNIVLIILAIVSALAGGLITLYTFINKHEERITTNTVKIETVMKSVEDTLKQLEVKKGFITYKTDDKTIRINYEKKDTGGYDEKMLVLLPDKTNLN